MKDFNELKMISEQIAEIQKNLCFYSVSIDDGTVSLQGDLSKYNEEDYVSLDKFHLNNVNYSESTYFMVYYDSNIRIVLVEEDFDKLPEHIKKEFREKVGIK